MTFEETLPQVQELLAREGRVAYRAIGVELIRPHLLALLAEAYEGMG